MLDDASRQKVEWGFLALGLVATVLVTWLVSRRAKATLQEAGVPRG
jgi:hypothetical protein